MAPFGRFFPVATDSYGAVAVLQCLADALAAEWHPLTSINCKRLVSANANDWSVAMHLGGQMRCNYAEPMRVGMRSLPARVGLAVVRLKREAYNGDSRHFCRHAARQVLRGLSPVSPLSPNQPSLHLGSHSRLPAASGERSPYWHDVVVPGLIDRRCRQVASGRFLDVLTPPSHHRTPALDVVRSVVSASDFVLVDMRQRDFD